MRAERDAPRRGNASVVITTLLSLLVVVAAVAVVAYLVLRTPSAAVDSAERLDPVGTALPAPTDPPTLPTMVPTAETEPEDEQPALGFTGEQPAAGLPTVAAPQPEATEEPAAVEEVSGPTPTPRVIAQPTEVPPTPVPAAPTLPPSVPVTQVPVVALQPVEAAPPPAPTSAPAQAQPVSQPTPAPADDDDPFNIFDDEDGSSIVPMADDPLERVREMQDEQRGNGNSNNSGDDDDGVMVPSVEIPDIAVPTPANSTSSSDEPPIVASDDPRVVTVPDADAMIDEITARATDPNRNPNVNDNDAGRRVTEDDDDEDDEDDGDDRQSSNSKNDKNDKKRKSLRDIIKERAGRSGSSREDDSNAIPRPNVPGNSQQGGDDDFEVCTDPTAPGFPFDC
jgi:hypothetical protein